MNWNAADFGDALRNTATEFEKEGLVLSPDCAEEVIHNFRVHTKKMRALLRLFATSHEESKAPEMSKKVRKIYKLAGKVRDAQLMAQGALKKEKEREQLAGYLSWLGEARGLAKAELRDFYSAKTIRKTAKRVRKAKAPSISPAALRAFFDSKLAAIEDLRNKHPLEEEDLHEIRKELKDLSYVAKIIDAGWPGALALVEMKGKLEELEKLTGRAGKFNDQHNALVSLEAYLATQPQDEGAAEVREKWALRKAEKRSKLLKAIIAFGKKKTGDKKEKKEKKTELPTAQKTTQTKGSAE